MKNINLHSIVLLVGPSGSGKSTFAAKHFPRHEVISSDDVRAELCGDFRIQSRNDEVFAEVHRRTELRVKMGQRVVIDATNLKAHDRRFFVDLAHRYGVTLYYLVVNRTVADKLATGGWRLAVNGLIEKHEAIFRSNLSAIMKGDGVAKVIMHDEPFTVITRGSITEVLMKRRHRKVMAVGDIHGNPVSVREYAELADKDNTFTIYLGDVIDYGDNNLEAFWFVYNRVVNGKALLVWGNHERKMDTWIRSDFGIGFRGKVSHGMQKTINELNAIHNKEAFVAAWYALESLSRQHYIIKDLLFTHGAATLGLWYIDAHRPNGEHGQLAYFGEVDKTTPFRDDGYPNRTYDWIEKVPAGRTVIVGHDIRDTEKPLVEYNDAGGAVVFLDTGSGKGGKLSYITYDV